MPRLFAIERETNGFAPPEHIRVRHEGSRPLVRTVGRTYLLELYHFELHSGQIRIVDGKMTRQAYEH
jgi:hypothetical protein